jgi:hypothetical protein
MKKSDILSEQVRLACTVVFVRCVYAHVPAGHAVLQHAPALSHSCRSDCMPENHAIVAAGDAGRAATSLRMERVARGARVVSSAGGG